MSISPVEPNDSLVTINLPGNPTDGFQPNRIEIDFKSVIELKGENRERIRNILTRAFAEILYGEIRVTFEDDLDDFPQSQIPWNLMRDDLLENGYWPAEPEPIDIRMAEKILCEQCRCGKQVAEGFRGRGYRVYVICPHCEAYQEL